MMRGEKRQGWHQTIGELLFFLYLVILCYCLFLADLFGRTGDHHYAYNIVPFREISRFVIHSRKLGIRAVLINLVGNVVCFIPFGLYLPARSRRFRSGKRIALSGCLLSLLIETVQLVTRVGCFDVDDILLNTLGCLAGFWLYGLASQRGGQLERSNAG